MLFVVLLFPIVFTGVAVQYFVIKDLEGWDERNGLATRQWYGVAAALDYSSDVEKELYPGLVQNQTLVTGSDGEVVLRGTKSNERFVVYYDIHTGGDCPGDSEDDASDLNVLTANGITQMITTEQTVYNMSEWQDYCLVNITSGDCAGYGSLLEFYLQDMGYSSVADISDPAGESEAALASIITALRRGDGTDFLPTDFDISTIVNNSVPIEINVVRTIYNFGLPVAGSDFEDLSPGSETDDFIGEQDEYLEDMAIHPLGHALRPLWDDEAAETSCVRVVFSFSGMLSYWSGNQLTTDALFIGGSIVFAVMYVSIHTRSPVLGFTGILMVILSVSTAFFFYRMVFQIEHFGTLQFLTVYIILGIGADDIFIFFDAWKQAGLLPAPVGHGSSHAAHDYEMRQTCCKSTSIKLCAKSIDDCIEEPEKYDPRARLGYAFKHAASAMLATSITTFASFVVTAFSGILNIQVFGIFASVMVLINFVLVCTLFPALLIAHETFCMCACTRCCRSRDCTCPRKPTAPDRKVHGAIELAEMGVERGEKEEEEGNNKSDMPEGQIVVAQREDGNGTTLDETDEPPLDNMKDYKFRYKFVVPVKKCIYAAHDDAKSTGPFTDCVRHGYAPFLWNYRWYVLGAGSSCWCL